MSVTVFHGNCKDVMQRLLEENVKVDSIVTDPPYELGFRGNSWDSTGIAHDREMWSVSRQLLKPGGHLLSFGGSRTYHRMACAIEDAGFEIRDQIMWIYATGFPKSVNISKALEKKGHLEESQKFEGWGTALKPAHEPIVVARKPLSEKTVAENVLKHGTGGINIDSSRVPYNGDVVSNWFNKKYRESVKSKVYGNGTGIPKEFDSSPDKGRFPANIVHDGSDEVINEFAKYDGRPASFNSKQRAKGKFRIDGVLKGVHCVPYSCPDKGRFPANIVHDGSDEVLDEFAKYGDKSGDSPNRKPRINTVNTQYGFGNSNGHRTSNGYKDKGTAARFSYSTKASPKERAEGNRHPTMKPVSLMKYLIKLVTPTDGTVFDMFAGSGTTGIAALGEGMRAILIEKEQEYYDGILRRHAEHPTKT